MQQLKFFHFDGKGSFMRLLKNTENLLWNAGNLKSYVCTVGFVGFIGAIYFTIAFQFRRKQLYHLSLCIESQTRTVWVNKNISCFTICSLNFMMYEIQWRIQDFPQGGAPTPKSAIIFQFFCRKLHENERIWTLGALHPPIRLMYTIHPR